MNDKSESFFINNQAIIAGGIVAGTVAVAILVGSCFGDMFKEMGVSLPPMTRFYVSMSRNNWLFLAVPVVAILFFAMSSDGEDEKASYAGIIFVAIACAIFLGIGAVAMYMPFMFMHDHME
ncbi:hypothetical protein ACFL54_00110 [Planctomycetota bacterium]